MRKRNFFIALGVLVVVLVIGGWFVPQEKQESNLTGEFATLSSNPRSVSKTVAICNESNFCVDYTIICVDGRELSREPIPGAVVQKPSDWVDERELDYSNLCDSSQ